ncbi:hypothetical protein EYR40_006034 [Pleurotus pulmonarius]|nr:hypothetical protein EYR36_005585 [Pleurotus pulmonarius]KAF4602817.1 hypothetical protein EYR40_006034 [Pleurotus pulmonarius]
MLFIKGILSRIFSFSTNGSNIVNACVCRAWSNEALSIIWYDIDAYALIALLAPLETGSRLLKFSRAIQEDDWLRFNEYAWRVRKIAFQRHINYDPSMFDQIKIHTGSLTPNLETLSFNSDARLLHVVISLFGHTSVHRLTLGRNTVDNFGIHFGAPENALLAFERILSKTPRLRTFEVSMSYNEYEYSVLLHPFSSTVCSLKHLQVVKIPAFWLTDPVIDALAILPRLRYIELGRSAASSSACLTRVPDNIKGYFPSLEILHFEMSFSQATLWLSQPHFPKTLISLALCSSLYAAGVDDSSGWGRFLEKVSAELCNLRQLQVTSTNDDGDDGHTPHPFGTLQPLLSLSKLEHLTLRAMRGFKLDQTQLVTLLRAFPYLKSLEIPQSTRVDLSCLAEIAPIAPNLQILQLNWHTPSSVTTLPDVDTSLPRLKTFSGSLSTALPLI